MSTCLESASIVTPSPGLHRTTLLRIRTSLAIFSPSPMTVVLIEHFVIHIFSNHFVLKRSERDKVITMQEDNDVPRRMAEQARRCSSCHKAHAFDSDACFTPPHLRRRSGLIHIFQELAAHLFFSCFSVSVGQLHVYVVVTYTPRLTSLILSAFSLLTATADETTTLNASIGGVAAKRSSSFCCQYSLGTSQDKKFGCVLSPMSTSTHRTPAGVLRGGHFRLFIVL